MHGAIAGALRCRMPDMPGVPYRGHFQGGALVAAPDGTVLARRGTRDGSGVAVADVEVGRTTPSDPIPDRFWLHRRGPLSAYVWHSQRIAGRRWYARHVREAPHASKAGPAA